MPQYQLTVAIALAISLGCSLFILIVTRPKEGKIRLPEYAAEHVLHSNDPFDVTKPEDVIDGDPIDGDKFWARMRLRKIMMSFLLAVILAIESLSLGWSIIEDDRTNFTVYLIHVIFALYTLSITVRSVSQIDTAHIASVYHIFSLTFIASSFLGTTALFPSTAFPSTKTFQTSAVPNGLWYTVLALYIIVCVVAVTIPAGPDLHYPLERIYSEKIVQAATSKYEDNVCGATTASIWDTLLFSYTTKVVMLGNTAESLEIGDLPVVPAFMRATTLFATMRGAMRRFKLRIGTMTPKPGSGWGLAWRLFRVNLTTLIMVGVLAAVAAVLTYTPAFFLNGVVKYLEADVERTNRGWGWVYCTGLFVSNAISSLITGQLWSLSTTTLQVRMRVQLNSILFAKTLVRKDVASSSGSAPGSDSAKPADETTDKKVDKKDEDEFSSKAQIMTLMTTDVDRVSEFAWHVFALVDSPIEIFIGTLFLYNLLGVSCFWGLAVTALFLPLNHFATKVVVGAQDNLMKARDQRVALMNEILGGIRMIKFMAWERSFEARVHKVRERELKFQKLNYTIETFWNAIWMGSPILVTIITFWHFSVIRHHILTPSIAFTSISIFNEMRFALNTLPETFINILQSAVSLRRIEKYLNGAEVTSVPALGDQSRQVTLQSATISWPQERARAASTPSSLPPSVSSTPQRKFVLVDLSLDFPIGELSLICGKLGSGKSLLLLALLGEADILAGQLICPRSPPDALASFHGKIVPDEEWVVDGLCAYVPQSAWLRNASIKDNILFELPYIAERYQRTLEVCALVSDLEILEDGDESEIGERGVNLSGGQKARVSLARAVYSRASVLLLDDVLSAVDAHTAHHLYHECLKGDLMRGRTVILVSHHVQLCAQGAGYIVALDNGRVQFQGNLDSFQSSDVLKTLIQSNSAEPNDDQEPSADVEDLVEKKADINVEASSETSSTVATTVADTDAKVDLKKKPPRKLVEEEKRATGRISNDIWLTYIHACGGPLYWTIFMSALLIAMLGPVLENGWLKIWSGSSLPGMHAESPLFYIGIYAIICFADLFIATGRWLILYHGGIHASTVLYKKLLEGVLFADLRFHDTVSRGRLLNRFGKDFEGIDSSLPDNFGRSVMYCLSVLTTFVTVSIVGGLPFVVAIIVIAFLYYQVGKVYGQTSRDMRRLDSVTRSPLYSIYGETIAGVTVLRAFGASSKFMRDMLRYVDTNTNPYYWMWGVNRWLSARFNLLSAVVVGVTGFVAILTPGIDAALAGFALTFASTVTGDLLFLVRRFVGLEQSMVAVERIKEFSELRREPPEFIEPRPPAAWPQEGAIKVENLVVRYAPELPAVLHNLTFEIRPGEKVGVLGRTGSGKSTLALSFFRFVEPAEGRILVDGVNIADIGLTDLRGKLTIIPQDPTIMSGTLRSTLDVFSEYDDTEIYEALRRVHLIPSDGSVEDPTMVNANVFRNLDSPVSEGGDNFSTGEKQLLCMARAILKRSKVLLMDEATASVDYATDELISKTIRHEFASSTIFTIAHRLRTVIDYDRVMLLDQGQIVEFDKPGVLLSDSSSKFHSLCKATGKNEFAMLKKMAGC